MGEEDIVIGWLVGNVTYIILTIALMSLLNVGLSTNGPAGDSFLKSMWNTWLLIGGLIGVMDLVLLLRPIMSALDGF